MSKFYVENIFNLKIFPSSKTFSKLNLDTLLSVYRELNNLKFEMTRKLCLHLLLNSFLSLQGRKRKSEIYSS